jgi:hypothetical protein
LARRNPVQADVLMQSGASTYRARNKVYGDSYHRHGQVMKALYPQGVELKTIEDFNRFGIVNMLVSKITRYANDPSLGHIDSIHDMGVYSFMLEELDRTYQGELNNGLESSPQVVSRKATKKRRRS